MFDRKTGLPDKISQQSTPRPTAREARVKDERTVDHPDSEVDILAETTIS